MLSEVNDLRKPVDTSTYDACFATIRTCDYFLLLIGGRAGALYDAVARVSVTQQEYRVAYECLRKGTLKILTFVRRQIWDVSADRQALRRLIEEEYAARHALAADEISKIANHDSSVVSDAGIIFAFLEEVGRTREMEEASHQRGPYPVGNWIHSFTSFKDIIDALRVQLSIEKNLEQVALRSALRKELIRNLQELTVKVKDDVKRCTFFGSLARLSLRGDFRDSSIYERRHLAWLSLYGLLGFTSGHNLSTRAVDAAISNGLFVQYDAVADEPTPSATQTCLEELRDCISRLRATQEALREKVLEFSVQFENIDRSGTGRVSVPNSEVIHIFSGLDLQENVIDLTVAIVKALDGDDAAVRTLKLRPSSPIPGEAEQIAKESPTMDELEAWIAAN